MGNSYYEIYIDGASVAPADSTGRDPHTRVRELIRLADEIFSTSNTPLTVEHQGPGRIVILGVTSDEEAADLVSELNSILPPPSKRWKAINFSVGSAYATKFEQVGESPNQDIDEPIGFIGIDVDEFDKSEIITFISFKSGELYRTIFGVIRLDFSEDLQLLRIEIMEDSENNLCLFDRKSCEFRTVSEDYISAGSVLYIDRSVLMEAR